MYAQFQGAGRPESENHGRPQAASSNSVKEESIERLSGAHWKAIADEKFPSLKSVDDLSVGFKPKAQAFLAMLDDNAISYDIESTLRPKERSYLFHYCLEVSSGRMKAKDVPKLDGVDINWDHGDEKESQAGAQDIANAFVLIGVAAHPSNHNRGDAMDLKMNFSKNTKDGKNVVKYKVDGKETSREIKVDDEAIIGIPARHKKIAGIASRELSKAGEDLGVKRAIDSDIVHWSLTGR